MNHRRFRTLAPCGPSGSVGSVPDVLAERATFSNPVAHYRGQAKAAHMLGLIAPVTDVGLPGD